MKWKTKKLLYFLIISHTYCLILGWLNSGIKLNFPIPYFFQFLSWWCAWNSILTIFFAFWKTKKSRVNNFFSQAFSLVTTISNIITMAIFVIALMWWFITVLANYLGTGIEVKKLVPIPGHLIIKEGKIDFYQLFKVIHWWSYSPIWHIIAPSYFIYWFFLYEKKNLLRKKIFLTIFSTFIMPTLYFIYCLLRAKLSPEDYLDPKKGFSRWPYFFLSSKQMSQKLSIERYMWKIILILFWFTLLVLITYFLIKFDKRIRNYLINKKKSLIFVSKFDKKKEFRSNFFRGK